MSAKFTACASAHTESRSSGLNLKRTARTQNAAASHNAHARAGGTGVEASHKRAETPTTIAACQPLRKSAGPIMKTQGNMNDT